MAPRTKQATPKATVLQLISPTRIDGGKNTILVGQVNKKFDTIELLKPKSETVHAVVLGEGAENLGSSMRDWVYAIVDAALSGIGQSPDGSACFVADNLATVTAHYGTKILTYGLRLTPSGRTGARKYYGTLQDFVDLCVDRAKIVSQSEAKYGVAKVQSRATAQKEEEAPTVSF